MKVVSGLYRGAILNAPKGHFTHPMSEKMRAALFNALGDIEGLSVLDVYSGSGALAIEALSRGATSATAVERNRNAALCIEANKQRLNLNQLIVVQSGLMSWISSQIDNIGYDLVFADPPYTDIKPEVIAKLKPFIKPAGLLVLSWPGKQPSPVIEGLTEIKRNRHGDGSLIFYRSNLRDIYEA